MSFPWAELVDGCYHKEDSLVPLFTPPGIDTNVNGLAGDTHLTHGELLQGVKATESVLFSPAELVFCRVSSLTVQELMQRQCEAGGHHLMTGDAHLSLDLVILLLKCTILIHRRECKCS